MPKQEFDRRSFIKPLIMGVEGLIATEKELELFNDHNPLGFIIFSRNIESLDQLRKLTMQLRSSLFPRNDVLILIDQEGGRVRRLKPEIFVNTPPMKEFGDMVLLETLNRVRKILNSHFRLVGYELMKCGINVNCAPLVDVFYENAHDIIGDRAFSSDPYEVGELGKEVCKGLLMGNVFPMIKHIPGHGRANCDSHEDLPIVDTKLEELRESDFIPFKALKDMPFAMTAHITYSDIDDKNCATQSKKVIDIIRNEIGFKGLLFSDDLSMKALKGTMSERANKSLDAGCDVALHCNGNYEEMLELCENIDYFNAESREKYRNCWKALRY